MAYIKVTHKAVEITAAKTYPTFTLLKTMYAIRYMIVRIMSRGIESIMLPNVYCCLK